MRVYVDAVMGINFLVDYLLLLGTNRLSGFPAEQRRLLAAAALGAVYSGVCLLPDFRFLGNVLWRAVSLGLMGSIAFGWNRSALRRCGVFLLLSLALGGVAICFERSDLKTLLLAGILLWLVCRLALTEPPGSNYIPLEISYEGNTVKLLALRDTGNTLRDPVTGEQALVISPEAAGKLTGLSRQQLSEPLETMQARPAHGLRLIPYRAVGQENGLLLAMRFAHVKLGNCTRSALVAFSPEGFGKEHPYQALTGGAV